MLYWTLWWQHQHYCMLYHVILDSVVTASTLLYVVSRYIGLCGDSIYIIVCCIMLYWTLWWRHPTVPGSKCQWTVLKDKIRFLVVRTGWESCIHFDCIMYRAGVNSGIGIGIDFNSNSNSGIGIGIGIASHGIGIGIGIAKWNWPELKWNWRFHFNSTINSPYFFHTFFC